MATANAFVYTVSRVGSLARASGKRINMRTTPRASRIKLLIIHRNCLIKRLKYGRWVRIQQNPATQVTRSDDLHRGPPLPAGGSNITGNLHLSYSIAVGVYAGFSSF
jgi:hypothetical protein